MAEDPHAAFYRFGRRLERGPIAANAWGQYLEPRFARSSIEVAAAALHRIVELTEGIPYYVMRVCRLLWPRAHRRHTLDVNEVNVAFGEILDEAGDVFAPTWEELTLAQRRTAAALAEGRGNEIFAGAVRARYELGAPSSVARSLERLRDLGLVGHEGPTATGERYRIVDPVFAAWVRRQRPGSRAIPAATMTSTGQEPPSRPRRRRKNPQDSRRRIDRGA